MRTTQTRSTLGNRRSRRGANIIEFAMTLPFFVLMMFALIDFGWYFGGVSILNAAVTEGCRSASLVDPLLGDPEAIAEAVMTDFLATVPVVRCDDDCFVDAVVVGSVPLKSIQCTVSLNHESILGWIPLPQQQSSSAMMRFEWQREQEF
jgi:hypothetical protein